ncbi:hypothetical protein AOQ73_25355 [Bradyrhizobium pachyrhizi]|nr:hypothetical protein AOQ73_25355 [Bradyrhizobium pachyrhizi]
MLERPVIEVIEPEPSPQLLEADAKEVLMRAVRGDPTITGKQMRAAIALLPFLYPKKGTSSGNANEGFAARLEGARDRSARVIEFRGHTENPTDAAD